ncbi:MAG TPA: SCO family protein [Terriglobales bacterium]|nr:SCO family protein [Terriglobales bacterium]
MVIPRQFARISFFPAIILLAALLGISPPAAAQGPQDAPAPAMSSAQLPSILKNVRYEQKLDSQVPLNLAFRDESGKPVRLGGYFGHKPVVLILAYYRCPMLCSQVLAGATRAFRQLPFRIGQQFNVLTVSFDPHETPELAAASKQTYIGSYGYPQAAEGWHFLTGQQPEITALTQAVGFHFAWDAQSRQYAHATGIVVLTPSGKVAQYFYGIDYPVQDLRLALVQSSQEKIGSLADEVLLFCSHYDPNTGRYTAIISRVLQIAGAFTLLILGGVLFLLFYLDRKKRLELEKAAAQRESALSPR